VSETVSTAILSGTNCLFSSMPGIQHSVVPGKAPGTHILSSIY
jgi:hypothetical protein